MLNEKNNLPANIFHPEVSVVVPIFNEEGNIPQLFERLNATLKSSVTTYEIIFVDDGSKDTSSVILADLYTRCNNIVRVIYFSRNFGHQLALTAGLKLSQGKAVVVIDADLQDPPETIADFIKEWKNGLDIVYGIRQKREGETFFKKFTAKIFYKLMRRMATIDIFEEVGDFYLLDRKVVDILNSLTERHRFIRGLISWVGFSRKGVYYSRKARFSGETKYSFWKMAKFSLDAMTSFSFMPLRFISWLGAFFSVVSFLFILVIIYFKLFTSASITGWSSIMATILFIGGIQLLSLGVIGEYLGRIGDDVKARPLYNVKKILGPNQGE